MSRDFERKAIEAALQLRSGMPEEDAKRLAEFNEQQSDWYAFCQVCGQKLEGTLSQMRAHKEGHQRA